MQLFANLSGYCGAQGGGPLGEDELVLIDDNGDGHHFHFETFFNRYDAPDPGQVPETGAQHHAGVSMNRINSSRGAQRLWTVLSGDT